MQQSDCEFYTRVGDMSRVKLTGNVNKSLYLVINLCNDYKLIIQVIPFDLVAVVFNFHDRFLSILQDEIK